MEWVILAVGGVRSLFPRLKRVIHRYVDSRILHRRWLDLESWW